MKQTAVEWLIEQLVIMDKQLDGKRKNEDATLMKINPTKILNQANEMFKQQAESIWKASDENMHRQFSSSAYKPITFEQYYNETFNK